jgi:hypothetical protein
VSPMSRSRSFTGTVTVAVLVAAFGNQWVSDWINKQFTSVNALSWFMHQLTAPAWSVSFSGTDAQLRAVVAQDVMAVLTIVLVYVLLLSYRKTFPEGFAGFVLGWATVIFASAIAGLAASFVVPNASLLGALTAAAVGSLYGLFTGWIAGFVVSIGRNIPWPRKAAPASDAAAA